VVAAVVEENCCQDSGGGLAGKIIREIHVRYESPYDTIEVFNVDSTAECDQLNLAHETKPKNASAHLVQYRFKIREGSPEEIRRLRRKRFVKEMF